MVHAKKNQRRPQLVCTAVACVAVLTHVLAFSAQPGLAATSSSQQQQGENGAAGAATSTQPLWSYQVKPTNYVGVGQSAPQSGAYSNGFSSGPASLFDAFTGLSQRQGALTQGSPFLSILPIILIAAGGLLLLLPMLTMMMASPFGGGPFGGGGGFQNYGGYPQVSGLNRRRSLDNSLGAGSLHKVGLIELIEHVSSTIEDLSRKYASNAPGAPASAASSQAPASSHTGAAAAHKRSAKALNTAALNHQPANELSQTAPANHKPAAATGGDDATNSANGLSNLVSGSL